MCPWDIQNLNPATRYMSNSDEKDPEKQEWIELKVASDDDTKKFFKEAGIKEKTEYKTENKSRQIQRLSFFEPSEDQRERFNEMLWDFCIVSWKLFDKNNNSIPCTPGNKFKFMRESPVFAKWVGDSLEDLRIKLGLQKDEEVKN